MADLGNIPTPELAKDLADSVYDIFLCIKAMEESGGEVVLNRGTRVAERAGHNLHFVNRICKELLRREYKPVPT